MQSFCLLLQQLKPTPCSILALLQLLLWHDYNLGLLLLLPLLLLLLLELLVPLLQFFMLLQQIFVLLLQQRILAGNFVKMPHDSFRPRQQQVVRLLHRFQLRL